MFHANGRSLFSLDDTAAMSRPKLYVFSAFIIGAAYARQFRTFPDLAEKLKMEVTDHGCAGGLILTRYAACSALHLALILR
jgi:hypothetical protein